MSRKVFTYQERLKMLMAAFEFCESCQREFLRFAEVPGRDAIEFMRDLLWNLWQNWPHGAGCPRALPEVPAEVRQDAVGSSQTGPVGTAAAQQPGALDRVQETSGSVAHVTGFELDPGTSRLGPVA